MLVPRERYVDGNSLLHGSRALSAVVGPSLGGALVQLLTAPVALAADALSFVASAVSLAWIRPQEPPTEPAESGHLSAGMRYIAGSRAIRASLAATATINFFNFVFFALVILYANRYLGVGPGALGLVLGLGAAGAVIGALITGRVSRRIGIGPTYVVGCIVFPAPLVLVPLAGGPHWLVLTCLFLAEFGSGLGVMMLDIASGAITAALVPDRLRARVTGAYMVVNYGVRPVGCVPRRCARQRDRSPDDAVDRGRRRHARFSLPAAVADSADAGAAGDRGAGRAGGRQPARSPRSRGAGLVQPLAFIP